MRRRFGLFSFACLTSFCCALAQPLCAAAPTPINTAGWADKPFVTADGQRLYFSYSRWNLFSAYTEDKPTLSGPDRAGLRHVDDPTAATNERDIFVATRKPDGGWNEPTRWPQNLPGANLGGMESGRSFYFAMSPKPDAVPDLYVSQQDGSGQWTPPQPLTELNTDWIEDSPYVSPSGDAIWFTSNRPGGYGGKDIYFSQKVGGVWTKPVNVGAAINSAIDEDHIWVSPTGNGDIFFNRGVEILQTQWKEGRFSSPLKFPIPDEDIVASISFTADGKEAFFAAADIFSKKLRIMRMVKLADGSWDLPTPID